MTLNLEGRTVSKNYYLLVLTQSACCCAFVDFSNCDQHDTQYTGISLTKLDQYYNTI